MNEGFLDLNCFYPFILIIYEKNYSIELKSYISIV